MFTVVIYLADGSRERVPFETYDDAAGYLLSADWDITADIFLPCGAIEDWGVGIL